MQNQLNNTLLKSTLQTDTRLSDHGSEQKYKDDKKKKIGAKERRVLAQSLQIVFLHSHSSFSHLHYLRACEQTTVKSQLQALSLNNFVHMMRDLGLYFVSKRKIF